MFLLELFVVLNWVLVLRAEWIDDSDMYSILIVPVEHFEVSAVRHCVLALGRWGSAQGI